MPQQLCAIVPAPYVTSLASSGSRVPSEVDSRMHGKEMCTLAGIACDTFAVDNMSNVAWPSSYRLLSDHMLLAKSAHLHQAMRDGKAH